MKTKLKALYIANSDTFDWVYGPEEQRDIGQLVNIIAPPQTRNSINKERLADVEIILTGWHAPKMDAGFLAAAPKLQAVFHAAGTVHYFTTDAFWDRDIILATANHANAVPVAEMAASLIQLSLKHYWSLAALAKRRGDWYDPVRHKSPGCYRSTVGLISLGVIGRMVRERLRALDVRVIAYDPFATSADEMVSLEELFREADVVSVHAPHNDETEEMITGAHVASMKHGATFINTARGGIVCESEMLDVLRKRPDLTAVLDVTEPEPAATDSPLFTLPNVVITPHIAGSLGPECRRMGRYMVEELRRYLAGEPLRWQVTRALAGKIA